jgi:hypothetical protein
VEIPDYERTRTILLETGDQQILRLVRIMDTVFRRSRFRPDPRSVARESEIVAAGRTLFPTPFARQFAIWSDDLVMELEAATARLGRLADDDPQRPAAERRARLRFRSASLQIETCWRQIVHFLPFIFIAALRRVDDSVLRGEVAKEVARALRNYNAFYVQYSIERQREAMQYLLLASLLKLFRQLTQRRTEGPDFLFEPLMSRDRPSLSDVFPERFDAGMLFLQEVRNRLTHGGLVDRLPAAAIGAVGELIRWVFLDLIAVLSTPCRAFGLNFVTASRVGPADVEMQTLDFSGIDGPRAARYRVAKEWQLEEYAFLPYRIYLVVRDKAVGASGESVLAPQDYLDLTPFLIVDRLRSGVAEPDPLRLDRQQLLFALQQYLEPVRQLLFSDLGGTGDRVRPADARDTEAEALLRQMGDFRNRYRGLIEQVTLRDQTRIGRAQARSALWRISRDHLATLVSVERYDESGALLPQAAGADPKAIYIDELYIEPEEGGAVAAFLTGDRRGLIVTGESGAGKSNLLVRHFLLRLRSGELAVFLSGRRFEGPSFSAGLLSKVAARISDAWTSLDSLADFLEENDETLTVFLDALNEYSGPQGPRSLLEGLIAEIDGEALRRCRIIASVRNETWAQYCAQVGKETPLDPAVFATPDGRPLRIGRFAAPDTLYAAYQAYYRLRPASFAVLPGGLRTLLARPFMMAMVAEAYSNLARQPDEPEREIPSDLDYFSIFVRLTERKAQDAQVLVPPQNVADRAAMPEAIDDFCALIAEVMFEQLTGDDPRLGPSRDALSIDNLNKRAEFEPYVQNRQSISVLEALLQVGLIERIAVPQRNREGKLVPNTAFKFFHDQYTQYCLAAAYQRKILGWLDGERLADPAALDDLVGRIERITVRAVTAPILTGALDHWLQKNLANFHDGRIEPVLPLMDRLASHGAPALRHEAVTLLSNLVLRGTLPAAQVYRPLFHAEAAAPALRLALADAFIAFWPQLPPAALRAFIDACDPRRDFEVLDRLADLFALHVALQPADVTDYLDKAISPLSLGSITEPLRIRRQARFAAQFAIFSTFSCLDRPQALEAVRTFVRAKFQSVLDIVDETADGSMVGRFARRTVRQVLFRLFDSLAAGYWNKFIAAMEPSGNDKFFVENDGVVQHDLLAQFLPYAIDLHNGEMESLSLEPSGDFRALALRMLDFRPVSIIGYCATIALPTILMREGWRVTESLVMELIDRRTQAAVYFGQLLLSNLAFSNGALALPSLELFRDRIIPTLLQAKVDYDWSMSFCVASLDVERLWPTFEGVLQVFFRHFDQLDDADACRSFGDHLYKVCYCSDLILGRKVAGLMLRDRARFLGPLWRVCTLKVLAALQTRNPAALYATLAAEGADESLAREALGHASEEILKQSRLFPFQVEVNRFVAWMFVTDPRLRRGIVKHFVGSLATGESVADFTRGVRQTIVLLLNVFFGDHPEAAPSARLSVEEIAAAVISTRGRRSTGTGVTAPPDAART